MSTTMTLEHVRDALRNTAKHGATLSRDTLINLVSALADAIDAHLAASPASAWQPIETAPKDGSLFLSWVHAEQYSEDDDGRQLIYDISFVDFCKWSTGTDPVPYGWWEHMAGRTYDVEEPTHWMPLPSAPAQEPST